MTTPSDVLTEFQADLSAYITEWKADVITHVKGLPAGKNFSLSSPSSTGLVPYDLAGQRRQSTEADRGDEVYQALKQSYPEDTIQWVKDASWTYDSAVLLDDIDTTRKMSELDEQRVQTFVDVIEGGDHMAPVILAKTTAAAGYLVADGNHRVAAYRKAGESTIAAYVGTASGDVSQWIEEMQNQKLNEHSNTGESSISKGLTEDEIAALPFADWKRYFGL